MVADAEKSLEYFGTLKEAGEGEEEMASRLRPVSSKADYLALLASGKPVLVDFYAPW